MAEQELLNDSTYLSMQTLPEIDPTETLGETEIPDIKPTLENLNRDLNLQNEISMAEFNDIQRCINETLNETPPASNDNPEQIESPTTAGETFTYKCVFCDQTLTGKDEPKILECLHNACGNCIKQKVYEQNENSANPSTSNASLNKGLECSICGYYSESQNFIDNQFLLELSNSDDITNKLAEIKCSSCSDDATATSWCTDCAEFICDNCVQAHQRLKITKDHTIKTKDEGLQESQQYASSTNPAQSFCHLHTSEKLALFCENCDKLTCRDCQLTDHRDHKYKFTHEIASDARKMIANMLRDINYKRVLLNSAMKVIDDRQALITEKKQALVQEITNLVVRLTNTINVRGKQLVARLNEVCDSKQKTLDEKKVALNHLSRMTDHCITFTRNALECGSDNALLYSKKHVTTHLQRIKSKRADIPNPEIPVRIHLALDKVPDLIKVISSIGQIVVDGRIYPTQTQSPNAMTPQNSPSPSQIGPPSYPQNRMMIPYNQHNQLQQSREHQQNRDINLQNHNQHNRDPNQQSREHHSQQNRDYNQQIREHTPHNRELVPHNQHNRDPNQHNRELNQLNQHLSYPQQHPQGIRPNLSQMSLQQNLQMQNPVNHVPNMQQTITQLAMKLGVTHGQPNPPMGQSLSAMAPSLTQQLNSSLQASMQRMQMQRPQVPVGMRPGMHPAYNRMHNPGMNNQQQVSSSTHPQGMMHDRNNLRGLLQPAATPNAVYVQTGPGQYQAVQAQFAQQFQSRFQQSIQQFRQQHQMMTPQQLQQQQAAKMGVPSAPRPPIQGFQSPPPLHLRPPHQNAQMASKWHTPQQVGASLGNQMHPNGGGPPSINNNFKIMLKAPNSNDCKYPPAAVTSTIPKTPSPNHQMQAEKSLDKFCEDSVKDLMATIAKLDSNGVQVLAENRQKTGSSPHVDSSTGDHVAGAPQVKTKSDANVEMGKDDPNEDWCAVCMDGGELVCCDKCPKVFHQFCHIPNLSVEESDTWQCLLCMNFADVSNIADPNENELTARQRKIAERIILEMYCQYETSLPFREVIGAENDNYHSIIKTPMALDIIRHNLDWSSENRYRSLENLARDVRLMFRNAYLFNDEDSQVYTDAKTLEKFFDEQLEKWLPEYAYEMFEDDDTLQPPNKKFKRIIIEN